MILKSKICGVSDSKTLSYLVNHKHPPQFVGFIVNYPKSNRYVDKNKLKELTSEAFKLDVFGAPTFLVNNKLFWGQDRLEYAIDEFKN